MYVINKNVTLIDLHIGWVSAENDKENNRQMKNLWQAKINNSDPHPKIQDNQR